MNIDKFRDVIKKRESCHYEYDYGIEHCNKEEIAILTEDIPSSIKFLERDCTAEKYSWISEIIDDIAEQTGSREFVDCYKRLMKKFPEECQKYNIAGIIEYAEAALGGQADES